MSSPGDSNRIFIVRHTQPSPRARLFHRSVSLGSQNYNGIPPSPQPTNISQPFVLVKSTQQAFRLPVTQSQRFLPYQPQVNRRARCNSDISPDAGINQVVPRVGSRTPRFRVCHVPTVNNITSGVRGPPISPGNNRSSDVNWASVNSNTTPGQVTGAVRRTKAEGHQLGRERLNAEKNQREEKGVPSSSFYNGNSNGESDFARFLRATCDDVNKKLATAASSSSAVSRPNTRKRLVLPAKPKKPDNVCITISSDSEDDCPAPLTKSDTPPSQSSTPRKESPNTVKDGEEMTAKKMRQDITNENPDTKPEDPSTSKSMIPVVVKTDEELTKSTLNLTIDSIRLGQMKLEPKTVLRISHESLSITAYSQFLKNSVILTIQWQWIVNCYICTDQREPCIFLDLTQGCLPSLRQNLGMVKGKFPYYDPNDDADKGLFIFYINANFLGSSMQCDAPTLLRKVDLIRKKLKKPLTFFRHIDVAESEKRQSIAAACMGDQPVKTQAPTSNSATTGGISTSTSISTIKETPSTTVSQMQTRKHTAPVYGGDNGDDGPYGDSQFIFTGPRIELFVYPPPPTKGGISVTNADQFRLNEGEFLNDVIIEFYLKYVYNTILSPQDQKRTHMYSCFFYERLMQKNPRDKFKYKDMSPAERRHSQVKKWTRNVDIFSKDFLFIPINEASHWYIAVICFPGMEYTDAVGLMNKTVENTEKFMTKSRPIEMQHNKKIMDSEEVINKVSSPSLPTSMQYLSDYGEDDIDEDRGQGSSNPEVKMDCQRSLGDQSSSTCEEKCNDGESKDQMSTKAEDVVEKKANSESQSSTEGSNFSEKLDSQPGINTNKRKKTNFNKFTKFQTSKTSRQKS